MNRLERKGNNRYRIRIIMYFVIKNPTKFSQLSPGRNEKREARR